MKKALTFLTLLLFFSVIGSAVELKIIIDALGARESTITIFKQYAVTTDTTVPANITLEFLQGGSVLISTTKTLTINGDVEAGLYEIFEWAGTGKVSFGAGAVEVVFPEWWDIDGIADQVQFQLANDALSAGGGIFASGAYSFTAALNLSSNIHLFGHGKSSSITSVGNIYIINISGGAGYPADNRGILVEKLGLFGPGAPAAGGGIYVQNCHESCFQNLWISDYTTKQLFIGIHIAGGAGTDTDNLTIRDNTITATIDTAIVVFPTDPGSAEENVISGNVITSAGRNGISLKGQKNLIIGNTIEESAWHGITLSTAARLNTVVGNAVCESIRCGIEIAGASTDNAIVGNIAKDNDLANSSTYSGIRVVDNSLRNIIANNICMDNDNYEIFIGAGSNNNTLIGNHVYGTDHVGTISDAGTDTIIRDNYGFVSENSGITAAIATATAVAHGLDGTPAYVSIVAAEAGPTDIYVTAVGAANFTVNFGGGGNKTFFWRASLAQSK